MRYLTAFIALSMLAGCVSKPMIDVSGKEPTCATACSSEYDLCMSELTMMPIRRTRDCARLYTYCTKACPEKK